MNRTMLLGIGGAGCNILNVIRRNSYHQEIISAQYSFADSDEFNLRHYVDDKCSTILIPNNNPLEETPFNFNGVKQLIVIAALGGKTGSKNTILAVRAAKEAGVEHLLVVGILPFLFEGMRKISRGLNAIKYLYMESEINLEIINMQSAVEKSSETNLLKVLQKIDIEITRRVDQLAIPLPDRDSCWEGYGIDGKAYDLDDAIRSVEQSRILSEDGINRISIAHSDNCNEAAEETVAKLPSFRNKIKNYLMKLFRVTRKTKKD